MNKKHLLGLLVSFTVILAGCGSEVTQVIQPSDSGTTNNQQSTQQSNPKKLVVPSDAPQSLIAVDNSGKDVTFTIKIDKTSLSNKRDLEVSLYNDEQLKISETTSNCSVSYDATTKKETTTCPSGVEYKKPTPEVFKFKLDEIKENITVKSTTVKSGKKFALSLSGMSSDNCNSAFARIEKNSAAEQETVNELQWASTMMACVN